MPLSEKPPPIKRCAKSAGHPPPPPPPKQLLVPAPLPHLDQDPYHSEQSTSEPAFFSAQIGPDALAQVGRVSVGRGCGQRRSWRGTCEPGSSEPALSLSLSLESFPSCSSNSLSLSLPPSLPPSLSLSLSLSLFHSLIEGCP